MRTILLTVCFLSCAIPAGATFDYVISDTYYGGTMFLEDYESLLVTGGGVNQVISSDLSYIEVRDTAPLQEFVGGIENISMDDNSSLSFYDGEMSSLWVFENARAIFEGGRVDYISSYQRPLSGDWPPSYWDKHIEIVCKNWNWNELTNLLTGTWADDTAFSIQLVNQTGYYPAITNIEFTIIPEPATLVLLGFGTFLIRKKQ